MVEIKKDASNTDTATAVDLLPAPTKREIIDHLPNVNQTDTLKKFFNATVDHLFQPKNTEKFSAYVGRRPSYWDKDKEFYLQERNSIREDYQLEPAMVSIDQDSEVTHTLFYDDLLNSVSFQGGIVTDHNRLFEQEYYSWAPPIDLDKLTAYTNYFWLEAGPDPVIITEATDVTNDVLGELQYTFPTSGTVLSSGMRITLQNDASTTYDGSTWQVEAVGRGILLLDVSNEGTIGWDEGPWDESPWSMGGTASTGIDYIVMERGCADGNPWSTGNKWYHRDVITASGNTLLTTVFEHRANRPIIEFERDLELYDFSRTMDITADVVYTETNDIYTALDGFVVWEPALAYTDPANTHWQYGQHGYAAETISGESVAKLVDGVNIRDDLLIMVTNDDNVSVNNKVYKVSGIKTTGRISLQPQTIAAVVTGTQAQISYGLTYEDSVIKYNGTGWDFAQRKTGPNQAPLFNAFDIDNVQLDDAGVYPKSDFVGTKIFGYKINTSALQADDDVLGFKISRDQYGEIVFENFIVTDRYTYSDPVLDITGLYFWRNRPTGLDVDDRYSNNWNQIEERTEQFVIDEFLVVDTTTTFTLSQTPEARATGGLPTIIVEKNGITLEETVEYSVSETILTVASAVADDFIVVKTFNRSSRPEEGTVKYEIPLNLQGNPTYQEVETISNSEYFKHFKEIMENQEGFTGSSYGINSWRDTAQDKTFGRQVIQHRAPLLRTMMLSSDENLDIMLAARYVEKEYTRYRNKFVQKINAIDADLTYQGSTTTVKVDAAIDAVNIGKTNTAPFYYSEMMSDKNHIPSTPSRLGVAPVYKPEAYKDDTFVNSQWVIRGHDGSQYIMLGEITGAEQTYVTTDLTEEVDKAILEFETRIYNNIPASYKTEKVLEFDILSLIPSRYRTVDYTRTEYLSILRPMFERWVSFKNINYRDNTTYSETNKFTWNYSSSLDRDGNRVPGNWRGMYRHFFDTDRPHTHPWEMLGFTEQPSWWDARYGAAPYTGGNALLWGDLEAGYIAGGDRVGTDTNYVRTGLSKIIPVDNTGVLLDPMAANIIASPPTQANASAPWVFGDGGPVEGAWIKSEAYPFALAQAGYLMKPARFIELGWDANRYSYIFEDTATYQWINTESKNRPKYNTLLVHGEKDTSNNVYVGSGIQQWISARIVNQGQSVTTNFGDILRGLDVRLGHKLGGFTDSDNLKATADNFGQLPQEDISVKTHLSPSIREHTYSGVVVKWTGSGWEVFGYDTVSPSFNIIAGNETGRKTTIKVGETEVQPEQQWKTNTSYAVNIKVQYQGIVYESSEAHTSNQNFNRSKWNLIGSMSSATGVRVQEYLDANIDGIVTEVPYGTVFQDQQSVYNFLIGYGRWLEQEGWVFNQINYEVNETYNWRQSGREFLWWTLSKWDAGNFVALSPLATKVRFQSPHGAIQSVEQLINGVYTILDKTGTKINPKDTNVARFDDVMEITPDDPRQGIFKVSLAVKELEHIVLFSNTTIFNDIVYNVLFNVRQERLKLNGFRSKNWTGRLDAPGFIVNGDSIYSNFDKVSDDFRHLYDIETSVEEPTLREHARHATGYQVRDYLQELIPDPDNSFQFYQGMIQSKGTPNSLDKILKVNNLAGSSESFSFYEEWMFRVGRYGADAIRPSLEIQIDRSEIRNNPQLIEFPTVTDNTFNLNIFDNPFDDDIRIWTHTPEDLSTPTIDNRWMRRPVDNENIWPLRSSMGDVLGDLPSAGYVKLDEIDWTAVTKDDIADLYLTAEEAGTPLIVGTTIWVYDDGLGQFMVYRISELEKAKVQIVNSGAPTLVELDRSVVLEANDYIIVSDLTKSIPSLEGIHVVSASTSNSLIIDLNSDTGYDYPANSEVGPEIYVLENVRFADNTARDASLITWQLNDHVWVDDARTATEVSNGIDVYWVTYKYDPSHVDADLDGWVEVRRDTLRVDSNRITNGVVYNKRTHKYESKFEVYDPRKGLIPAIADKELSYKIEYDPAKYTDGDESLHQIDPEQSWGPEEVGRLWWDISAVKYLDYEIADNKYRTNQWGNIAPGTSIDVYEWVRSSVAPDTYDTMVARGTGSGSVKGVDNPAWVAREEYDTAVGALKTYYYFWVKNVEDSPSMPERSMAAINVAKVIENPTQNNVVWCAAVREDALITSNVQSSLIDEDTVIQINWKLGNIESNLHSQWALVSENNTKSSPPDSLWDKMRDSLVGYDADENIVPDSNLTEIERYGTLIRPRQTWYKDITLARKIFVESANAIFADAKVTNERIGYDTQLNDAEAIPTTGFDYTVADIDARDALIGTIVTDELVLVQANAVTGNRWTVWEYTNVIGTTWTRTDIQEYKVDEFWDYAVWYDTGISADIDIEHTYADNAALNAVITGGHIFYEGDVVKISDDGTGVYNLLKYNGTTFDTVAIENGTIEFNDLLYTYNQATNINNLPYPHMELRILLAAIKDDIMLAVEVNNMFFAQINYVHSEQEMVDWAVKSSLLHLTGLEDNVTQNPIQVSDNTSSIIEYINEVKPYHTKIHDIVQNKNISREDMTATLTDFDKPIYTDTSVSPSVNRKLYLDLADYLKDHLRDDPSGTNFDAGDIGILNTDTPWKQWYDDYIDNTSANVRKHNIKVKFDRVKSYTDIPIEGTNSDSIILLASATTENNSSEYNIFTVINSTITINNIILNIAEPYFAEYVGDSLTTTFRVNDDEHNHSHVITDPTSLTVTKGGVVIYENGVQLSVLAENQISLSPTGDSVIFTLAPNTGDAIRIDVDETFNDPNAYVTIGNTVNGVLSPESILRGPDNESDIALSGSLNFTGDKQMPSDFSFGYDSNVKVVISPGTSISGKVTVTIEYTLDVRLTDFVIDDLDAADRVALFYNPRAGMERKAITEIEEAVRIKGTSIYMTNTTDDAFYRKRYDVRPISGSDFKGTIVDGSTLTEDPSLDTLLDGTSSDWTTTLFTAGIDGTDVFTLDTPLDNVNDAKVSVNGTPMTLGIEYDIPDPPKTQIVFNPSDVPAVGEVIQVVVGTTFDSAPTDSSDIIIDGNEFLQPHWASDRPEELSQVDMDTSLNFSVYFPGTDGSPIVIADRFISDGITANYPLLQLPQSNEGVLVYSDGLFLDHGTDFTINWTTRELEFINIPASTTSVKVVVFSHGGNRIVNNLLRDGGTDTYTLTQPSIQNNVLVFVDGDPETGFTVSGRTVTLASTPSASSKVLLVAFGTNILEQIVETGDGIEDTYTLVETPADADRILALVNNSSVTFTLSGNDVILDAVPASDDIISITLFEIKAPTLVRTESFTGTDGVAGSVANSRVYTVTETIETTLPKAASIMVKKNGLRLAPENTIYYQTNAYQRVYILDNAIANPVTDITLWADDTLMTWGTDYVVPDTLRGTFDSSLDITTNLTNLGMTIGSLQAGDYFNIINTTEVSSAVINEGGTGYSVSDVLTVVGGTGTAATLTVDAVSGGVITAISVTTVGNYTVQPPNNSVSVTGGTGGGATIILFFTAKILDFDGDWNVTVPGLPTVATFDTGTAIVYTGASFSAIQNATTPTVELHFENLFTLDELVKLTTNGDKDYIVTGDSNVTVYDVSPSDDIDITYFSVDTTFNIHTQVFEESIDGSYRISQVPFSGDYIWVTVNGLRKVYMRDYRILKKEDGWDTSPWDTQPWDAVTEYNVIQMNPYEGTQAEFDVKVKDTIVVTTIAGPPVSESIAYRMFKDFNKDGFGNWAYSRIADVHKFRIRTAFNIGDSSIDLDVNENVLASELPDNVLFNPTDSTPGVIFVDNERIEYWNLEGPFADGTTGRDWYRVSTLARGTKLTPVNNYSVDTLVIEAGTNQEIPLPYTGGTPDTDAVPNADMAIVATAQTTNTVTNGTDVEFNLGITPSFATITSIYTDVSDTSTLIDQSLYTLANNTVTFTTAPTAGSIDIVQVEPDSINLQKITNQATVILNDRPGHFET